MQTSQELIVSLQASDVEVLREAAFAAAEQRCGEAVPYLAQLVGSRNMGVQEAAESALRTIGGEVTVRALVPLLRSDEPHVRNIAMDVLRQVGGQHLQSLIEILHDEDPDIRIFASDILGSTADPRAVQPLGEAMLKDPEVNVRYQAAISLGTLAFPEGAKWLNRALSDEEWVQFAVIESLAKIKDDASVGALAKALEKSSDLVASIIVEALGDMGNIKAVNLLLRRLDASPAPLQSKIITALVKLLGGKSLTLLTPSERGKFLRYLLAALKDEDPEIQDTAIQGLGFVGGEEACAEILALLGAMDIDQSRERILAGVDMLVNIGPAQALIAAVAEHQGQKASVAVEVISRLGDADMCAALMAHFWESDRDLQREMVKALLECAGDEAGGFFREVLGRHEDGTVLKAALAFLGRLHPDRQAGQDICALLEHPYDDVKEAALEACIGNWDEAMSGRFEAMAEDGEAVRRMMAVYAFGKVGRPDDLERVRKALGDPSADVRRVAFEAMAARCCDDPDVLDNLARGLGDDDPEVRKAVVASMSRLEGEAVSDLLAMALTDGEDWVRIRALEALAERDGDKAVERIAPLVLDGSPLVAFKAVEAVRAIGGPRAMAALRDALSHEDPQVQGVAAEALAVEQGRHEVQ